MYNYIKTLSLLSLMIGLFTLSGCNTFEGVGKDLQKAGSSIEKVGAGTKYDPDKDGPHYDDHNP